jgi:hypothetical protein
MSSPRILTPVYITCAPDLKVWKEGVKEGEELIKEEYQK